MAAGDRGREGVVVPDGISSRYRTAVLGVLELEVGETAAAGVDFV